MVKSRGPPRRDLWAYAYDIALPESEDHLRKLQVVLDQEHAEASDGARTWAGTVVVEPQIVRVLVVSDSPAQDRDVNRRLEAELMALNANFDLTAPMAVLDDVPFGRTNGPPPNEPS